MNRNLTFLIFLFCLFGIQLFSQPGQGAPAQGTVIGIIKDSITGEPLEYAAVGVFSAADSSAKGGTVTDKSGSFTIRQVPNGKYYLRITFVGYNTSYSKPFSVSPQQLQADVGIIRISSSSAQLDAVTITDTKADYTNGIDKKIYDVNSNITATGGTATDVLQNVPAVTVDMDGKISLRGNENVTILIDGKPSGMTGSDRQAVLSQIPAAMIDHIEIITNPSARYDAQGMAGIINIVTKRDSKKGFNGSATVGAGTNNKYNAGLTINNRSEKVNFFANYNWRYEDRWFKGEGLQHTFTSDTNYYYKNPKAGLQKSDFHSGKMGADFYLNAYNTLSASASYSLRKENNEDSVQYSFLDSAMNTFSAFSRRTSTDDLNKTIDANLDFKKAFPGSVRALTASAFISSNIRQQGGSYKNDFQGYTNPPYQLSAGLNKFISSTAQVDYVHPFNDSMKFETGAKYSLRDYDNIQDAQLFDYTQEIYNPDARFTDHFYFNENVYAAYLQFGAHIRKFDYQAGVRAEYTDIEGKSYSTAQGFSNNYLSLFPSATVRYTPKYGMDFQLGYSRRLNRPANGQLNPFLDFTDSLNIRTGNPYLLPEFIHSSELSFNKMWEKITFNLTVYYRHTDNMISMARLFDTITGVAYVKPRNFSTSDNIGADMVIRYQIGKKGSVMVSVSGFNNKVNGSNIQAGLQSTNNAWNGRFTANYKVLKNTNVQLTGMYMSKVRWAHSSCLPESIWV
ncbi:MAG: TonB-dependent receptor [Bacteroidia bacterium]